MEKDEPLRSFISNLNTNEKEVAVLGEKYSEKKFVKKLIRCLPKHFEAYKTVIKATINSDETKFDKLVGLLMSFKLERTEYQPHPVKVIVFTSNSEDERVKNWKLMSI